LIEHDSGIINKGSEESAASPEHTKKYWRGNWTVCSMATVPLTSRRRKGFYELG